MDIDYLLALKMYLLFKAFEVGYKIGHKIVQRINETIEHQSLEQ